MTSNQWLPALLGLLAITTIGALLLTVSSLWRFRKVVAISCLVLISFVSVGIVVLHTNGWSIALAVTGVYQAVNIARVLEGRMPEQFARHVVRRTTLWLAAVQAIFASGLVLELSTGQSTVSLVVVIASVQLLVAIIIAMTIKRQLRTTAVGKLSAGALPSSSDSRLPSITVAIPARNEDAQLEACLTSVLASDYSKLEILVLDDCSADKTPDIIRSYAHAGVRFIKGSEPTKDSGWLAKNQAYDQLYHQASGSLILFCGVDIRFERSSLRQLVATLQQRNKTMVNVLPQNLKPRQIPLLQAMRYYWELAPPRRTFNRPPVLSSCWLITKASLQAAGGFASVKRAVTPEAHFARSAIMNDGYSFIRSDSSLNITSQKPESDQLATAVQTKYTQLQRRPELVLLVAATQVGLLLAPLAVVLYGVITLQLVSIALGAAACLMLMYSFGTMQKAIFPNTGAAAYIAFWPAIVADIAMLHYSMYKYEFSEVYWKGRNICYPALRAHPHLPKLQ